MPSLTEGTPMSLTAPADAASARTVNDLVVNVEANELTTIAIKETALRRFFCFL